jgi:hypothetical protein
MQVTEANRLKRHAGYGNMQVTETRRLMRHAGYEDMPVRNTCRLWKHAGYEYMHVVEHAGGYMQITEICRKHAVQEYQIFKQY